MTNNSVQKRQQMSSCCEIESALLEWLKQARTNSVAVSGRLLAAQAQRFAEALGYSEFQCSLGWLECSEMLGTFKILYRAACRT